MNILLTNDDGYAAPGIWALANRLKDKHKIYIVAPDGERSGASHSASFFSSLSYEYKGNIDGVEVYSLSGTPADCVVFSVKYLLKDVKLDCVLSGINNVLNVGSDIMFSGTFGAAQEATYQGIKGVAVSLRSKGTDDYDYSAEFTVKNLDLFLKYADESVTVNVNIPCAKKEDLKGVEVAHETYLPYVEEFYETTDASGKIIYKINGHHIDQKDEPTRGDCCLCDNDIIAITPIRLVNNDFELVRRMQKENFKL
ncbi:MAG: 5'/3'-nucleotidase SurE [Clostridia bacterium]|nr:5'/3'-nucleotidase SurE [Clostridia bacterium]